MKVFLRKKEQYKVKNRWWKDDALKLKTAGI